MKVEFTKGAGVNADMVDSKHLSDIIDMIYPVGAVYISAVNTNPATLFGGTWVQIKDKFLLSAGDTHSAGSTGGEETHILSTAEMPVHKHDVSIPSSGTGTTSSDTHNHTVERNGEASSELPGSGVTLWTTETGSPCLYKFRHS
ncbi:phage baseplate protein [Methanobacterium sp.]|uniref:phage baseplate protein n=1 Tax=Methanobacterium sp. TaxID=2164 RepID=UPI003C729D8A